MNIKKHYNNKSKSLDLSNSGLKIIPPEVFDIKEIVKLNLMNNQIDVVNEEIGELVNLEKLFLNGNQIKSLPSSIVNLKKLKDFRMSNNPLDAIQAKYLWDGLPNLFYYLSSDESVKAEIIQNAELDNDYKFFQNLNRDLSQGIDQNLNFLDNEYYSIYPKVKIAKEIHKLKKILMNDKVKAIKMLFDRLSHESSKYDELILISSDLNYLTSENQKGLLTDNQNRVENAKVTNRLLNLINEISYEDTYNYKCYEYDKEKIINSSISDDYSNSNKYIHIAILDIDNFSVINNKYGTNIGNAIINKILDLISNSVALTTGHLLNDEFFLVFHKEETETALNIIANIVSKIKAFDWGVIANDLYVTVCAGVSIHADSVEKSILKGLIGRTKAKKHGTNSVKMGPLFLPYNTIDSKTLISKIREFSSYMGYRWYDVEYDYNMNYIEEAETNKIKSTVTQIRNIVSEILN